MDYTVKKLSEISGVSVRTLHYYDEVGLLKPAYTRVNGYRIYGEEELLRLQQVLFFREMGLPLKEIKLILCSGDFNQMKALASHRVFLKKKEERLHRQIQTIDRTIDHLKGKVQMKHPELYEGFNPREQSAMEQELIERFGEKAKVAIAESKENSKDWAIDDFTAYGKRFNGIADAILTLFNQGLKEDNLKVQGHIQVHFDWLHEMWTPDQETYTQLGELYCSPGYAKVFEKYPEGFARFLANAMKHFATLKLS